MSSESEESVESLEFEEAVKDALKRVNTILSNTRNPCLASADTPHTYDDKFTLSEFLTRTSMMSLCNAMEKLGMDEAIFLRLINVASEKKKSLTLRFATKEACEFLKETVVEVAHPKEFIQQEQVGDLTTTKVRKMVTKVKQCHWKLNVDYAVYIFAGNDSSGNGEDSAILQNRTISCEFVTRGGNSNEPPFRPTIGETVPIDVSLTWLLQHLDPLTVTVNYGIDRSPESCRTPGVNRETLESRDRLQEISSWCAQVRLYFVQMQSRVSHRNAEFIRDNVSLETMNDTGIFVPVLPIFETMEEQQVLQAGDIISAPNPSPILPVEDTNAFLAEQCRTMSEQIEGLHNHFVLPQSEDNDPPSSAENFITSVEATIVLICKHMESIVDMWGGSIQHIEDMLRSQLFAAIGKTVKTEDLNEFIRFHNKRLFSDIYAPEPFCYAIRRDGHYPDGVLSIEEIGGDADKVEHAMTFTRKLENKNGEHPMFIPINAATSFEFKGDLFLHAFVMQRFGNKSHFNLAARARQFSSFLLILGKVSGPDTFEPEHAIILQNKDEVLIPLLTEEMPSSKEFKDAIESLSPDQKRFAEAFRSMQLSSSVFGVCVIQLKPQLEVLLGLPDQSLTKEIRLTQDLLSLFIEYQIPSDLLSFDGGEDAERTAKIDSVKCHVKNVKDIIDDTKKNELSEQKNMAAMNAFASAPMPGTADIFGSAPMSRSVMQQAVVFGSSPMLRSMGGGKMLRKNHTANAFPPKDQTKHQQQVRGDERNLDFESSDGDFTMIPKQLDSKFGKFGQDEMYGGVVRSTTIKTGLSWTKTFQSNLLTPKKTVKIGHPDQKSKRNEAIDLLDALSRSGSLPIACAELHIIVASTHCFEKSVVNTVVQDNVNPIEKIERTHLLIASTIHNVSVEDLLRDKNDLQRISMHSSLLVGSEDVN